LVVVLHGIYQIGFEKCKQDKKKVALKTLYACNSYIEIIFKKSAEIKLII